MQRPQYITIVITILLVISLFAATRNDLFGERKVKKAVTSAPSQAEAISTDSILFFAKKSLPPQQVERLNQLENSVTRGDVRGQKLAAYHQLAHFWADTAKVFAPYAWYTAEAARLENSEKSLTFAAHLFLNNLMYEDNPQVKQWEASQAKDLFERSLSVNPENDSSKVGLGAAMIYGASAMPMEGLGKIREVLAKDSANIFALLTLGKASLISGQLDKAIERFQTVHKLEPTNAEPVLLLADTYERMGRRDEAIEWYKKSIPLVPNQVYKQEVEHRINELKNK